MHTIKAITVGLALTFGLSVSSQALAAYPDKPVRLVVPNPPGGSNDKLARVLAERLSKAWGQSVVVENRAGASTSIGAQAVANANPDGYTLLLGTTTTFVLNPLVRSDLKYDPKKDFEVISILAETPPIILTHPNSQLKTVADLVDYAKANPGKLMYSTAGTGTTLHVNMESFASGAALKLQHVPYQGSAPAMLALLRNDVPVMSEVVSGAVAQVKSGQVRALAVGANKRLVLLPDVPTIAESGYTGFNGGGWWALAAPKATPAAVQDSLRRAINAILVEPEFQAVFAPDGLVITPPRNGSQVDEYLDREIKFWTGAMSLINAPAEAAKPKP